MVKHGRGEISYFKIGGEINELIRSNKGDFTKVLPFFYVLCTYYYHTKERVNTMNYYKNVLNIFTLNKLMKIIYSSTGNWSLTSCLLPELQLKLFGGGGGISFFVK